MLFLVLKRGTISSGSNLDGLKIGKPDHLEKKYLILHKWFRTAV